MIPEANLSDTGAGLVPSSTGWFVMNARDARWFQREGKASLPFTGTDELEAESYFPMLGMSLQVLSPGQPNAMYHWETEQENFLVLAGEAILIVEGQERPLQQWDFVHCPPETQHVFVGAGEKPCYLLAVSSRQFQASGPWGRYTIDEAARRHSACPPEETQNADVAYAYVPPSSPSRFREGWLPSDR